MRLGEGQRGGLCGRRGRSEVGGGAEVGLCGRRGRSEVGGGAEVGLCGRRGRSEVGGGAEVRLSRRRARVGLSGRERERELKSELGWSLSVLCAGQVCPALPSPLRSATATNMWLLLQRSLQPSRPSQKGGLSWSSQPLPLPLPHSADPVGVTSTRPKG